MGPVFYLDAAKSRKKKKSFVVMMYHKAMRIEYTRKLNEALIYRAQAHNDNVLYYEENKTILGEMATIKNDLLLR